MLRHPARERRLAYALAAVAGFVDATGFLETHGLFVSFMTGNSTRLALATSNASPVALTALALVTAFVAGVVLASLAAAKSRHADAVLMPSIAIALALAGLARLAGVPLAPALLAAMAMGALNLTFRRDGEVSIAIGYMTGNLVKLGLRLAEGMTGTGRLGAAWPPLAMWMALVCGAIIGALVGDGEWTANYFIAAALLATIAALR